MKKFLKSLLLLFIIALCSLGIFLSFKSKVQSKQVYVKTKIASGFNLPTDFINTPDGRTFVLEKGGTAKVIKNGTVLSQPLITLNVGNLGERGLLGIALDPDYTNNKFVYLYYVNANPLQIRVSRFTESNDELNPASEVILLKSTQALNSNHHSGTLRFGSDGKLWITVGNNTNSANSQDLSNIHGKILRINKDGSIPADNPFGSAIWAYGLRNPFRFNFLPDGRPIIADVGEADWEEVDLGVSGGNYGFAPQEGPCTSPCPYINPVYAYPHNNSSASITGGFAQGTDYFFGDYAVGFIKKLTFDSDFRDVMSEETIDDNAGTVVELLPNGPDSFMFLTIFPGDLYKMTLSSQQIPIAKISASPTSGPSPLNVAFSSEGSNDPSGKQLTYKWDFGDGGISTEQNPTHTYSSKGKYTAHLKVNNGNLDSDDVTIDIFAGDTPPEPTINTPALDLKYNAGNTISFSGDATDKEDGDLPAANFTWDILFHHSEEHIHPYLNITGVKSGSFIISDNNEPSEDTWYEVRLTVADAEGLKVSTSRSIYPNKADVLIASNPQGLNFTLDGSPKTTPFTFTGVVGFKRSLAIQTPQNLNGENFNFDSWSDGGALSHTITTPSTDTTITARFKSAGSGVGNLRFRIQEWDENNNWTGKFLNDATIKLTDIAGGTVYQTKLSEIKDGQDGWAWLDGLPSGTYGIMAFKAGYEGIWKQIDCNSKTGTFTDAAIQNTNTQGMKAAWDNNAPIEVGKTTVCQDLGLKPISKGNLYLRVGTFQNQGGTILSTGYLNDVTVKLTDTSGNTVTKTVTTRKSSSGQDGWAYFDGVTAGTYGLMAYKAGYDGYIKFADCTGIAVPSTLQNANTEGMLAAWNNSVTVIAGKVNLCYDLGLKLENQAKTGSLRFRIQEWDKDNNWVGKFVNGAIVKLTNQAGDTVVATSSSGIQNNQEGWVFFDDMPIGTYGIMAFKDGLEGVWKQVDCSQPGGSFTNATIQNNLTEGKLAAFDNEAAITEGGVTVCQDLGLKSSIQKGSLRFRIQEWSNNSWTGKFLNDAIVKLTDVLGNTVIATQSSANRNNEDGWVWFDDMPVGTYGIMAYKTGYKGLWKQVDCSDPDGSFQDATINNSNTTELVAAWDNNAAISSGQVTVCQDLGLKLSGAAQVNSVSVVPDSKDASQSAKPTNESELAKESSPSSEIKKEEIIEPKTTEETSSKTATTSAEVK